MQAMCMCQVQMYFEVFFFCCIFEMEDIGALRAATQQRQMDKKNREPFAPQNLLCRISLSLQFQGHISVFFIAQAHCRERLHM